MGSQSSIASVLSLVNHELQKSSRLAVVLSAMSGVTDLLVLAMDEALKGKSTDHILQQIRKKHVDVAEKNLVGSLQSEFKTYLEQVLQDTKQLLQSVTQMHAIPEPIWDLVAGQGEYLSSKMFATICRQHQMPVAWLDARQYLFVSNLNTGPAVDWPKSTDALRQCVLSADKELIITPGFVATTVDNVPTTLKRNGSDHSASIIGALLDCKEVVIWTDVDGIMSADPRLVKNAKVLPFVSYIEALELAYFGAKVIHPKTMIPAMEKNIILRIKNTFNPTHPGTLIGPSKAQPTEDNAQVVRGVTSIDDITILTLEGAGMIGVPGIAEKMFSALKSKNISVVMIGQGSSEYSICVAIRSADAKSAKAAVEDAFMIELSKKHINAIELVENGAILALVGEGMEFQEGVAATLFTALARAQISVRMIAQGSSEHNISLVIERKQLQKALNVVHGAFYLSRLTIGVALIGPGLVGKTLLRQIQDQMSKLTESFGVDIKLLALANSKNMSMGDDLLPTWKQQLASGVAIDINLMTENLLQNTLAHKVIIDCTSSQEIANHYAAWLSAGLHVITPNKKASSGDMKQYRAIVESVARRRKEKFLGKRGHYFYETTVGAGLPVISTLQDLLKTGDRVLQIDGVFSGTLSYLFNQLELGRPFSQVLLEAKSKGYTEPDPRDDLSGLDVARKLTILARECGIDISLSDIALDGLVPAAMATLDVESYLNKLSSLDIEWQQKVQQAQKSDSVLRYVASLDEHGKASVGIKSFPRSHAFARLQGSDNIISFKTQRYHEYPLIVQGPGAGAEVTAAGVFADLMRLAEHLRAAP